MMQSKLNVMRSLSVFVALFVSSVHAVPPNLWWSHIKSGTADSVECVNRAESVLRAESAKNKAEKPGKFKTDETSIRFINDSTRAVVECMKLDGSQLILIITSSSELEFGNRLYQSLKTGLSD